MTKIERLNAEIRIEDFSKLVENLGESRYSFWQGRIVTDQNSKKTYSVDNLIQVFKSIHKEKRASSEQLEQVFNKLQGLLKPKTNRPLSTLSLRLSPRGLLLAGLVGTASLLAFCLLRSYSFNSIPKPLPEQKGLSCKTPSGYPSEKKSTFCQKNADEKVEETSAFYATKIDLLEREKNTLRVSLKAEKLQTNNFKISIEYKNSLLEKKDVNIKNLKERVLYYSKSIPGFEDQIVIQQIKDWLNFNESKKDNFVDGTVLNIVERYVTINEFKNPETIHVIEKAMTTLCHHKDAILQNKALEILFTLYSRKGYTLPEELMLDKLFANPAKFNEKTLEYLNAFISKSELKHDHIKNFIIGLYKHTKFSGKQKKDLDDLLQNVLVKKYGDYRTPLDIVDGIFKNTQENFRGSQILGRTLEELSSDNKDSRPNCDSIISTKIVEIFENVSFNPLIYDKDYSSKKYSSFINVLHQLKRLNLKDTHHSVVQTLIKKITIQAKTDPNAFSIIQDLLEHVNYTNDQVQDNITTTSLIGVVKAFCENPYSNENTFSLIQALGRLKLYDAHLVIINKFLNNLKGDEETVKSYRKITFDLISKLLGQNTVNLGEKKTEETLLSDIQKKSLGIILKESVNNPRTSELPDLARFVGILKNNYVFNVNKEVFKVFTEKHSPEDCELLSLLIKALTTSERNHQAQTFAGLLIKKRSDKGWVRHNYYCSNIDLAKHAIALDLYYEAAKYSQPQKFWTDLQNLVETKLGENREELHDKLVRLLVPILDPEVKPQNFTLSNFKRMAKKQFSKFNSVNDWISRNLTVEEYAKFALVLIKNNSSPDLTPLITYLKTHKPSETTIEILVHIARIPNSNNLNDFRYEFLEIVRNNMDLDLNVKLYVYKNLLGSATDEITDTAIENILTLFKQHKINNFKNEELIKFIKYLTTFLTKTSVKTKEKFKSKEFSNILISLENHLQEKEIINSIREILVLNK